MPFPLHKAPQGLLELLRLRTLGANPPSFNEAVSPVVDVSQFYGNDLWSAGGQNFTAENFPVSVTFDEIRVNRYFFVSAGVIMGAAGGTYLEMSLSFRPNAGTTTRVAIASRQVVNPVAGVTYRFGYSGPPFVVPAGAQFLVEMQSDAAGADHVPLIRTGVHLLDGR